MYWLMSDQFRGPYRSTSRVNTLSSSALHGPLVLSGLFLAFSVKDDSDDEESEEEEEYEEHLL